MIPYSTQDINEADIKAVAAVLRSQWVTQGPALAQFEKAIAKKISARFAVAFNSGTAALHAAYFAAGIGKGDEVIVPALTFAATANAALYLGATPVFADSDADTGNMSVADARTKITKKTKAIVRRKKKTRSSSSRAPRTPSARTIAANRSVRKRI